MSNEERSRIAFVTLFLLSLLLLLCYSCNSVKRVLADPGKKELVGREWAKVNPCVTDTVLTFTPGDTIVTTEFKEDTLFYYVNDTIRVPYGINQTRTINRFVHDSIKVVVRDLRAERILQDSVQQYFGKMKMAQSEAVSHKKVAKKWKLIFWLLIIAAGGYKFRFKALSMIRHIIPVAIP